MKYTAFHLDQFMEKPPLVPVLVSLAVVFAVVVGAEEANAESPVISNVVI